MKPSEFFIKTRINNQRWCDSDEANESTITELDKRFIDREELKDKIKNILEYAKSQACIGAYNDKDYLKIYEKNIKKILELLK